MITTDETRRRAPMPSRARCGTSLSTGGATLIIFSGSCTLILRNTKQTNDILLVRVNNTGIYIYTAVLVVGAYADAKRLLSTSTAAVLL